MNGIDEFFEATGAIFAAIVILLAWLTYLEQSLHADQKPRSIRAPRSGPVTLATAWMKARRRN